MFERSKNAKFNILILFLFCFRPQEIHLIISGAVMFQYYIKIVPTVYVKLDNTVLYTNQFSVTRHQKSVSNINSESGMPGAFFSYELSPLMVKYTEKERYFFIFYLYFSIQKLCDILFE